MEWFLRTCLARNGFACGARSGAAYPCFFFHQAHKCPVVGRTVVHVQNVFFETVLDCRGTAGYVFGLWSRAGIGRVDEDTQCYTGVCHTMLNVPCVIFVLKMAGTSCTLGRSERSLLPRTGRSNTQCGGKARRIRFSQNQMVRILETLDSFDEGRLKAVSSGFSRCKRSLFAQVLAVAVKRFGRGQRVPLIYMSRSASKKRLPRV